MITGTVPESLWSNHNVRALSLDNNLIQGNIPEGIPRLNNVYLGNNMITGTIPNDIGFSTSLTNLSLEKNLIQGSIPASIGSLWGYEDSVMVNLWKTAVSGPILSGGVFCNNEKLTIIVNCDDVECDCCECWE